MIPRILFPKILLFFITTPIFIPVVDDGLFECTDMMEISEPSDSELSITADGMIAEPKNYFRYTTTMVLILKFLSMIADNVATIFNIWWL